VPQLISGATVRFAEFEVDPAEGTVRRNGFPIAIQEKPLQVLLALLEHPGGLVTREELCNRLWPGDDFGAFEDGLNTAVRKLRIALNDSTGTPQFVETVPKRGYRFIAPVTEVTSPVSEPAVSAVIVPQAAVPQALPQMRRWLLTAGAMALTVSVAALLLWRRPAKPGEPNPYSFRPVAVTSYPGNVYWPSFSPDGREIAFQWDHGQQEPFHIFTKHFSEDGPPHRVTSGPFPDMWPAWSPDGTTIAFERFVSPTRANLILVSAHGGPERNQERKLGEFGLCGDRLGCSPVWSPNGKWLIVPVASGGGVSLYRVSANTGEASPIVAPKATMGYAFPTLSPDGKTLLYVEHPAFNSGTLWRVHVDADLNTTDEPRQVETGGRLVFRAIFTADGKEILARDSSTAIIRLRSDGTGSPQPVPISSGYACNFGMALYQERLAYVVQKGNANIWSLDLKQTGAKPELLIASESRDVFPQYSPNGRRITFYTHRENSVNIWASDADGNNQRQVTRFRTGTSGTAHWSPDGKTLSFDSNSSGVYQVYTVRLDGQHIRQMTHGAYSNYGSSWSRDGRWLYFTSKATGHQEIWKIPVTGGTPKQVTQDRGGIATESIDGKTLFYCKDDLNSLWRRPLDGVTEELVTPSIFRCSYAVAREGLYYTSFPGSDGKADLMLYRFSDRRSVRLMELGIPEYGLDVSPDGRYLVFSKLDDPGSDLMMLEHFR
jgi:Tol biopolymer transport system component/DNA-binding winged helix-turn-helix (wHTH) protein